MLPWPVDDSTDSAKAVDVAVKKSATGATNKIALIAVNAARWLTKTAARAHLRYATTPVRAATTPTVRCWRRITAPPIAATATHQWGERIEARAERDQQALDDEDRALRGDGPRVEELTANVDVHVARRGRRTGRVHRPDAASAPAREMSGEGLRRQAGIACDA